MLNGEEEKPTINFTLHRVRLFAMLNVEQKKPTITRYGARMFAMLNVEQGEPSAYNTSEN